MTLRVLTARESVQQAIARLVIDFRKWSVAETKTITRWKTKTPAYAVAEGKLINDVSAQLDSARKKDVTLPLLIFAVEQVTAPPELSYVIGTPQETQVILKNDPEKRRVVLRTEPRSYHVQFAFIANDVDSANSFASQFCSYIRLMEKRRFKVTYNLAPDLTDDWDMTIFDNSIYPDSADVEEGNIVIGLLDFNISGLTPRVIKGLPQLYPDDFGKGSGLGGDIYDPKNPNYNGDSSESEWGITVEANLFKDRKQATFKRITADAETREITEEEINNDFGG